MIIILVYFPAIHTASEIYQLFSLFFKSIETNHCRRNKKNEKQLILEIGWLELI